MSLLHPISPNFAAHNLDANLVMQIPPLDACIEIKRREKPYTCDDFS
jgi:hypothetical protein